jgi:hypothetical protein
MFVHAESVPARAWLMRPKQLSGRMIFPKPNVFFENHFTSETDSLKIWPEANNLDFALEDLINKRTRRNSALTPNIILKHCNGPLCIIGNLTRDERNSISSENTRMKPCTKFGLMNCVFQALMKRWVAALGRGTRLADMGIPTVPEQPRAWLAHWNKE